jgi:acetoin utilization deacetylase AcuC-like enzyme
LARDAYREVAERAIEDLRRFRPDLVAVSAGFDAYSGDPLCQQLLEPEDFHWFGRTLRELGIPVFSLLEGGYSDYLPELILAYLQGLEGRALETELPGESVEDDPPTARADRDIEPPWGPAF